MKKSFSPIITAVSLLLYLPLSAWAADELPLAVVTPQFAPMESMAAIGKLLAAFLVIGALMALLFKGIKKMGLGNGSMSKGGLISVLDTRLIAPKKYIAVVRVAGENLAIGISDNSFSLLCKLGPDTVPQDISSGNSTFNDTLCKANLAHNEEAPHA